MKKIVKFSGVCVALACLMLPGIVKETFAGEAEVVLNGEVTALMLDFSVPSTLEFVINPNATESDKVFVAPEFEVENKSGAPMSVSISKFENNGGHVFTDVLPSEHADWTTLGVEESTRDLALGVTIDPLGTNDWYETTGAATDTIYAKQVQDGSAPILVGGVKPNSSVHLGLTASHGYSFNGPLTTKYLVTFIFEIL